MKKTSLKEIEQMILENNDYQNIAALIKEKYSFPECMISYRYELYEVFKEYHHHDLYELMYIISGSATFFIEDKKYELVDGDMVLIAPNLLHKLVSFNSEKCERVVINFTENYAKKFQTETTNILKVFELIKQKGMHKISFFPEKRKRLESVFDIMQKSMLSDEYGDDLRFYIAYLEVMLLINRVYMRLPDEELIQKDIIDPYVTKVIEYINLNIHRKIQLNDIATHLSLSISRISHIFKDVTGISIINYIIKKRLILAKELLKAGENIKSVYTKCGFPDEASFFRYFKKEYAITPKKYALNISDN